MWSTSRNLILLWVFVLGLSARAFAAATATITVGGGEQQVSGVWDTKSITISFNGYTETVSPGQFSTTASIASAFAAQFSRDYAHAGLSAQVVCGSSSSVITFALGGTATFGAVNIPGSTTSFQMSPAGFQSVTSQVYDTGTVTLTVNNITAATTNYGADATPATIAAGLAAGVTAGSFVNVTAINDGLYLVAKQQGAGTDYRYSIQTTNYNSTVFTQPSFVSSPLTGSLEGGANAGTATQAQPIYSFNAGYDGASNMISYADSSMGNPVVGNWNYSYDSLNRLEAATSSSGAYNGHSICWAYDSFGNRLAESLQTGACPASEASVQSTVSYNNSSNQPTSASGIGAAAGITLSGTYSYDGAGDVSSDGSYAYLYDAEGRICAVENIKFGNSMIGYLYDAEGTRVSKGSITTMSCDPQVSGFTPTSDYIVGPSNEQLTELDLDPNQGVMVVQHNNVWAAGTLLATYDADGTHFYLNDPVGTRRAQTDSQGVLEQNCQSLPYGNGETCAPTPTEHLFTGKERDTESGLDYFGARYYASSMGRWMSPDYDDDNDEIEPVPYANPENPQTLNLYSYVVNNPLSKTDATGHTHQECGAQTTTTDAKTGATTVNANCHDVPDWYNFIDRFMNFRQKFKDNVNANYEAHKLPQQPNNKGQALQDLNNIMMGAVPLVGVGLVPKAQATLDSIDKTGQAPPGQQGGRQFMNNEGNLPSTDANGNPIKYQEWDVNPKQPGVNRGGERLVTGSDGSAYTTADHYQTFTKIR